METFKAWRELIRAVKDIAIAIGGDNKNNGGDNKNNGSADNIKFWKESLEDESELYNYYVAKVGKVLKNNIVNPAVK